MNRIEDKGYFTGVLPFYCPSCHSATLVRDMKTFLCMDCYVPLLVKKEKCRKCGQLLLRENDKKICLKCRAKMDAK